MKIILSTPNSIIVNKNRNVFIKHSKILLQEFYKYLKKDILKSIQNKQKVNLDNHKEDFKSLLKIIYKKIITSNPNSMLKNIKIDSNKKANIEIDKNNINEIENTLFYILNKDLDSFSDERATLIFDNLIEKINDLNKKAINDYNTGNKNIMDDLQKVNVLLLQLSLSINAPYIQRQKQRLEKQQQNLQKELARRNRLTDYLIQELFIEKYDNEILENSANMQAQNEVDNFEGLTRNTEYNIISNLMTLMLTSDGVNNEIVNRTDTYAEWKNPKDEDSRITHANADGQIVKNNELFKIQNPRTGVWEYTNRPQGIGLSIESSINCRCIKKSVIVFELQN